MGFTSRMLSRSKQLYVGQVLLRHQDFSPIQSFSKEVAPVGLPPIRGDDFASLQNVPNTFATPWPHLQAWMNGSNAERRVHVCRYSTLSEAPHDQHVQEDFLAFIKFISNEIEGPNHCWLNKNEEKPALFNKDGMFLVIVAALLLGHHDHNVIIERAKLLQQRFPELQVFGLQCSSSTNYVATQSLIMKTIMEEYITFPVLLLDKEFTEITDEACFLLFEDYKSPLLHHQANVELGVIVKEIEEFGLVHKGKDITAQESNSSKVRPAEVIKEPHVCSFRNLLLYNPACVSTDEHGNRLFLSDTNHHRIVIADGDGKIIDCIGSHPGFEDGEFESAKLLRPAASFYHATENCLYFADSENHAIRRADMEKRVLETVYPVYGKKTSGVWSWVLDKLGLGRETDPKPAEFDCDALIFPWHVIKSEVNDLLVISRSFETSWTFSMATGEIKGVLRGFPNIMETYGQMIMKKASPLEEIFGKWLEQRIDPRLPLTGVPYAGLMSSVAKLHNDLIFCDSACQRILRCQRETGAVADIQFSDFEVLGLPYWLACPLEGVFASGLSYDRQVTCHVQCFSVLPGRCDIKVNVDISKDFQLAAPLQEGCVWRQARGSAAEVFGSDMVSISAEKVGVAQQWFDELDNLAFSNPAMESCVKDEEAHHNINFQDENTVHIDCAVNISPGTSEVIISAVLYLKLRKSSDSPRNGKNIIEDAARILDLRKKVGDDACIELLLESCRGDLREIVFMKPLHLRIRLDCGDLPTARASKEVVTTHSTLQVKVSLS